MTPPESVTGEQQNAERSAKSPHPRWCESNYTSTEPPRGPKPCNCGVVAKANEEVVEWDEFGQGRSADGECVVCICGVPYPHRWDHYCPYDNHDVEAEA